MGKKRILFIAEAVTLAHVARPLALSAALDAANFDLIFACSPRCHWLLNTFGGQIRDLVSMESGNFLSALADGKPVYNAPMLHRYVEDDLRLLESVKPDAVIGDFRLSLSVSARLAGIPYLSISNAYWSPYWRPKQYPLPNLWLSRLLPLPIAVPLFRVAQPLAFARHCMPLNQVRQHYGLPSLGNDLRRIYTDADRVVYADVHEFFPDCQPPETHRFIGPIIWSPPEPLPQWWGTLPVDQQTVYVTLGSSGQARLLPRILDSLASLPVSIIVSTAGKKSMLDRVNHNIFSAPYLPGTLAAQKSALVICNGGSPTCQQALSAGVPIIGIADNLDQFLNMETIETMGAGKLMRADRFDISTLTNVVQEMLSRANYRLAAGKIAEIFKGYDSASQFRDELKKMLITQ